MSVNIAVTGLNAAQQDITNTSNNIANVGTLGFKASSTEFGDIYASSPYAPSGTQIGNGVELKQVKQNFTQGTVSDTGNTLDLAIQGAGFFTTQSELSGGATVYTRAGAFGLDAEGYIVNSSGYYLQAYPVSADGALLSTDSELMQPIQIPMENGETRPTSAVDMTVNMSSSADSIGQQEAVPPLFAFNPLDPGTYAQKTPITVLDENGDPLDATVYFVKTAEPDGTNMDSSFEVYVQIEGEILEPTDLNDRVLTYDEMGDQTTGLNAVTYSSTNYTIELDLNGSTLTNQPFSVSSFEHNGQRTEALASLQVDDSGVLWASYGDQLPIALGQVAMANFSNPQGLKQVGSAGYVQTPDSGEPLMGQAAAGGFGKLRAAALENSNVDLTRELVDLISAQRNYQASAKALETSSSLAQTILNMRS